MINAIFFQSKFFEIIFIKYLLLINDLFNYNLYIIIIIIIFILFNGFIIGFKK